MTAQSAASGATPDAEEGGRRDQVEHAGEPDAGVGGEGAQRGPADVAHGRPPPGLALHPQRLDGGPGGGLRGGGADDPGRVRDVDHGHEQRQPGRTGLEHRGHQQDQQQRRHGEQHVQGPHQQVLQQPPPGERGKQAERHGDGVRQGRRRERGQHHRAAAVQHLLPDVPPDEVGTEPVPVPEREGAGARVRRAGEQRPQQGEDEGNAGDDPAEQEPGSHAATPARGATRWAIRSAPRLRTTVSTPNTTASPCTTGTSLFGDGVEQDGAQAGDHEEGLHHDDPAQQPVDGAGELLHGRGEGVGQGVGVADAGAGDAVAAGVHRVRRRQGVDHAARTSRVSEHTGRDSSTSTGRTSAAGWASRSVP
ncbi:hypothetical protein GCM10020295_09200 [Streptomyces cinereospinus]